MTTSITTFQKPKAGDLDFPFVGKFGIIESAIVSAYADAMDAADHVWTSGDLNAFKALVAEFDNHGITEHLLEFSPLFGTEGLPATMCINLLSIANAPLRKTTRGTAGTEPLENVTHVVGGKIVALKGGPGSMTDARGSRVRSALTVQNLITKTAAHAHQGAAGLGWMSYKVRVADSRLYAGVYFFNPENGAMPYHHRAIGDTENLQSARVFNNAGVVGTNLALEPGAYIHLFRLPTPATGRDALAGTLAAPQTTPIVNEGLLPIEANPERSYPDWSTVECPLNYQVGVDQGDGSVAPSNFIMGEGILMPVHAFDDGAMTQAQMEQYHAAIAVWAAALGKVLV